MTVRVCVCACESVCVCVDLSGPDRVLIHAEQLQSSGMLKWNIMKSKILALKREFISI